MKLGSSQTLNVVKGLIQSIEKFTFHSLNEFLCVKNSLYNFSLDLISRPLTIQTNDSNILNTFLHRRVLIPAIFKR